MVEIHIGSLAVNANNGYTIDKHVNMSKLINVRLSDFETVGLCGSVERAYEW